MFLTVTPDAQFQEITQRIHHRHANPVQTTRDLVGIAVELPARMQLGHDHFGRRNALFLVNAHRNATTIVTDRHGRIRVDFDRYGVRMTCQCLVNSVIHHLIDHMMQTRPVIGVTDIHTRTLANRL